MKIKIFTFVKPSLTATQFSHKIARFVSEQLDVPITHDDSIASEDLDLLIIVAGGVPFCQHLPALAKAVLRSEHVVYCTNDYATTKLPSAYNRGRSPYRAAFRLRNKRGLHQPRIWSTIEGNDDYVNWNALAWQPEFTWSSKNPGRLFYYGSWRKRRLPSFDLFFKNPKIPTWIANNSGRFEERYPKCNHVRLPVTGMIQLMSEYGAGLYIEDPKSHAEFHSPACRFYEMLSAGLPIAFHSPCVGMLEEAGYTIPKRHIVSNANDLRNFMKQRIRIAKEQTEWHERHHSDEVIAQFDRAYWRIQCQ